LKTAHSFQLQAELVKR